MNNNTFIDPFWYDTFQEIWDADLSLMEHGLDVRLMDSDKARAIKKTKFAGRLHFAWDRMQDEELITKGLKFLDKFNIKARFYVLIGFDTTVEENIHRCQILIDHDQVPYCMPYTDIPIVKNFKSFMNSPNNWWHDRKDINIAWKKYNKGNSKKIKPDESQTEMCEMWGGE